MAIARKISTTKNYRLFARSADNRALCLKKHKKLYDSMRMYGFLSCFPLACSRDESGSLIVKDGQHRLAIAEELGLPVHYVEEAVEFDVAVINCTPKTWALRDYAEKFSANGSKDYQEGVEFADLYKLPIGTAFALLAGTASFGNVQASFVDGAFKIKDREWAESVASTYSAIVAMSDQVRNARFVDACMAACRTEGFDVTRMVRGAERCREKLVAYSTRDAYLEMMEVIYNFGRKQLVPLKIMAQQAMKDRNVVLAQAKSKKQKRELVEA